MKRLVELLVFSLIIATVVSKAEQFVPATKFSTGGLAAWRSKSFDGETQYSLVAIDGRIALSAESVASASGLWREVVVDLTKTPYMNWSWQVDQPLSGLPEKTREGDDFVARIYAIKSGGLFFWRTRSICYVWSGSSRKGNAWENAYTSNVMTVAVQDEHSASAQWYEEKRNVRDDFKKYFNIDVTELDAVAIMTDTDNSGTRALALYGDIYFSTE